MLLALALLTRPADSYHLRWLAEQHHLSPVVVEAIARQESDTVLNPRLRGHACRGGRDCDVGRFQIRPSTARERCPGVNVFTYRGNTECFVQMFAEDQARYGTAGAIRRHNSRTNRAAGERYLKLVEMRMGQIELERLH